MTPYQKLKREILLKGNDEHIEFEGKPLFECEITEDNVDQLWREGADWCFQGDFPTEFREGEVDTDIPCECSRHYESKSVAAQMCDGSWVGWTYWYGGGKHGCPEEIDWMDKAYDLKVTEEQKMVTVRTFEII